jgi:LacI family transcriptional regulator
MKKNTKLVDVANAVGVSVATVSMVLSGKGKISKEVCRRVIDAAAELGYSKRLSRNNTGKKQTKYIAILHYESYEYGWNFIKPCILTLEDILLQNGYFPVIFDLTNKTETDNLLQRVLTSDAGAVFSIHYGNADLFQKFEDMNIPVIVINNTNFQDRFFSVCVDDFQGAYEGTLHLIKLGHEKILYLDFFRPHIPSIVTDRFIGFKKALDEKNINFSNKQKITIHLENLENVTPILKGIFKQDNKPTAIFFHDDYVAALLLKPLRDIGICVPDDVSIIAPGDVLDYSQPFLPQITTMKSNTPLMAKLAGDLMIGRIKNESDDQHVLKVSQQLHDRGSCRDISN